MKVLIGCGLEIEGLLYGLKGEMLIFWFWWFVLIWEEYD